MVFIFNRVMFSHVKFLFVRNYEKRNFVRVQEFAIFEAGCILNPHPTRVPSRTGISKDPGGGEKAKHTLENDTLSGSPIKLLGDD